MALPSTVRRCFVALSLALALAFGLAGCGGGGDGDAASDGPTRDGRAADRDPAGVIPLTAGPVTVENLSDTPADLPSATVNEVLELTQKYVDAATVTPLLNGHAAADINELFALTVVTRVGRSGPDRAALTDDAVPVAKTRLTATAQPVKISALTDGFGGFMMIAASIDYTVRTNVSGGPITIKRFGDLYFMPSGKKWLISAYQIGVSRDLKGTKQTDAARRDVKSSSGAGS